MESKWMLKSRTFWVNGILLGLLAFFLSDSDVSQMKNILENPDMMNVMLLGPGAMNVFARYFTAGSVSGLFSGGRSFLDSRTVRSNLLLALPIYFYFYQRYQDGQFGTLSTEALAILALIPIANIIIRLRWTSSQVTLLPGPLGKIL